MDREQVTQHLERLYDAGQQFELVAVKDGQARRKTFSWGDDTEAVLEACETFENLEWNVYSSVLPLDVQESGNYDRVWFDRDDPTAPWPFGADPNWEHPAWPEPVVTVRTSEAVDGYRFQAVWKLKEPVTEKEGRELIKQIAERGAGDKSVHDPRRVLRIAGIKNPKRGMTTRLLASSRTTVTPEQFMLPELTDEATGMPTIEALRTMQVSAPHMVLGEWLAGTDDGDRARKAYVTARFLKSCGVLFDDALPILVTGARRAQPPLSDDEVLHAARSAYHRQD